jgi:hypothetical protein
MRIHYKVTDLTPLVFSLVKSEKIMERFACSLIYITADSQKDIVPNREYSRPSSSFAGKVRHLEPLLR